MATPESTAPSDPIEQALISLVIRGMMRGAPDEVTAQLIERGLAMTKGPITMPTPEGTATAAALLRLPSGSPQEQDLDKLFDGFLPINRRLRDVCSAWQTRPDGTPNDHSDGAYDDTVRDRLDEVHSAIGPVLEPPVVGGRADRRRAYRDARQIAGQSPVAAVERPHPGQGATRAGDRAVWNHRVT